jgi:hypothetical protein
MTRIYWQNILRVFKWCWRRKEKVSWTDHVKNVKVLHTAKEEMNILRTIERSKTNWFSYILRRNYCANRNIEGRIKVTGRRGRRSKHLLDGLKETRGFWKLKEETLRSSHFVENSLSKKLGTCRKTNYGMTMKNYSYGHACASWDLF